MTNTRPVECGQCGGVLAGTWDLVVCRKCGHELAPLLDVGELDADEVLRMIDGVLYVVTFSIPTRKV